MEEDILMGISVNDLYVIKQNSKRENLENVVLKITLYFREIHFIW